MLKTALLWVATVLIVAALVTLAELVVMCLYIYAALAFLWLLRRFRRPPAEENPPCSP